MIHPYCLFFVPLFSINITSSPLSIPQEYCTCMYTEQRGSPRLMIDLKQTPLLLYTTTGMRLYFGGVRFVREGPDDDDEKQISFG